MSLLIKNLQASIENKQILKGVNLEVKPGELHAIMGPNGGGKSTLANVLAGNPTYQMIENKDNCQIQLNKFDLVEMSPDERAAHGLFLAFQYPVEIPGVKINNFLWEAYKIRFGEKRKFKKILDFYSFLEEEGKKLGLDKQMLSRDLNQGFSGGEKKRLEILQMNVLAPEYAVLDETDSGLDVDAIKVVASGIKKVIEQYNTGVIIITHYQRILDYLNPDFVHIMVDGKIVQSGGQQLIEKVEQQGYESFC